MTSLAQALAAFGATAPRLISERENAVYEVRHAQGGAALRLHREGYQSGAAIRSEMIWMQALRAAGFNAPAPIPARDGALAVKLPTGRFSTLLSWVDGAPLGEGGQALPGTPAEQQEHFTAIGREIARLHNVTDTLDLPPGFTRPRWDIAGFLGPRPLWGRFWENPALKAPERKLIDTARARARADLEAFAQTADFGLIHADVLRENVLITDDGKVTLIDYDDAGFGFRLYDLATLMSQNEDLAHADALRAAALAGYRELRPLSRQAESHLELFVLLRRFASMGWAVPRVTDPAIVRQYADRALKAAWTYLEAA